MFGTENTHKKKDTHGVKMLKFKYRTLGMHSSSFGFPLWIEEHAFNQAHTLRENRDSPSAEVFPECQKSGTRGSHSSPSVALGEEKHSGKWGFPECRETHGTRGRVTLGESHLPRVQHSGKSGTHKRKFTFDGAFGRNRLPKKWKMSSPSAML
jgi:hypothetical protein